MGQKHLALLILRILVVAAPVAMFRDIRNLPRNALGKNQDIQGTFSVTDQRKTRIKSFSILLVHATITGLCFYTGNWNLFLVSTLAWPIGDGFENLWHETQYAGRSFNVNDMRLATRSIHVGPFIKWFYWGLDHHVEHHLFPAIPSSNLPELRQVLNEYLPEARTLTECWQEILTIAKEHDLHPESEYLVITKKLQDAEMNTRVKFA